MTGPILSKWMWTRAGWARQRRASHTWWVFSRHRPSRCSSLPPHSSSSTLSLVPCSPHWESLPKSVSWVLTDAFYDSEECKCVGIFKRSPELQLSTIVILHSLPAKTNMAIVGTSPCSESITGSRRAIQHCVNWPRPTQSPIGLRIFSQWKYPCKRFVSFCL